MITAYERMNMTLEEFETYFRNFFTEPKARKEIFDYFKLDPTTIRKYLKQFNLQSYMKVNKNYISLYERLGITRDDLLKQIIDLTANDFSCYEIAKLYGVSQAAITSYIVKLGITRRPNLRDPDWLYEEYIVKKRSAASIGKELGVTYQAVIWHLGKNGFTKRTHAESQRNRNRLKEKPNIFLDTDKVKGKLRSYSFYWNGHYFQSTIEYIFYKMNRKLFKNYKTQPFVFMQKRPDILADSHVYELKASDKDLSPNEIINYLKWGEQMSNNFGYSYSIVYVVNKYPKEYKQALKWLRENADIRRTFVLEQEI